MKTGSPVVVTGALGYSGRFIARRLIDAGARVRTLTNSPDRPNPFGEALELHPYNWDDPVALAESLRGCDVLINTYWVRFNHRLFTFERAVANTKKLFAAAKAAGVRRIVHTSIANPSLDSELEYFRGKAELEAALKETCSDGAVTYAILRPAVLFGGADILVNNIAWALRRLPVFGVFGDGAYRLQPMHVEDFAALAVRAAGEEANETIDAIGPETFTYRGLVAKIGEIIGVRRPILSCPPGLGHAVAWCAGKMVGDVIITRDEIRGLMGDLLVTDSPVPPEATTRLTEWAAANRNRIGIRYASEVGRRVDRGASYDDLSSAAA